MLSHASPAPTLASPRPRRSVTNIFGGEPKPPAGGNPDSNTLISDMTTVICLDDYHCLDRNGRKEKGVTALAPEAQNFDLMYEQVRLLKAAGPCWKWRRGGRHGCNQTCQLRRAAGLGMGCHAALRVAWQRDVSQAVWSGLPGALDAAWRPAACSLLPAASTVGNCSSQPAPAALHPAFAGGWSLATLLRRSSAGSIALRAASRVPPLFPTFLAFSDPSAVVVRRRCAGA
jgi:hypothetical protein